MLDNAQNIYLIVVWVVLSLTYLALLNRIWAPSHRRVHNDAIGWQIAIIGTIYAVMIGFMLFAVWTNFQDAEANSNGEANALINIFRGADGLPAQQRGAIQIAAVNYGNEVLTREWTTMHEGGPAHSAQPFMMQLWAILTRTPAQTYSQQVSLQQSMRELTTLTEHRRIRILESEGGMPTILWMVLVIGGIITIVSCGLIGTENIPLHYSLIVALSLLISLSLVAIGDIDRPFQGTVHVAPSAFLRAQETMLHPTAVPK